MRKDYHMHPTVLATPERFDLYVQKAINLNIKEICVTDHMPLSLSNASDRIERGKVAKYCERVREFAKKYSDTLTIKCGIEIDYHPSVFGEIERVLDSGQFDYVLASSHMHVFINDYNRYGYNDVASLAIENSIKAVETGLFDAVAHLDMYRYVFEHKKHFPFKVEEYSPKLHKKSIKQLLDLIAKTDTYLEINPHLVEKTKNFNDTYPDKTIVKWALDKNVRFSYGSDAHEPNSVGFLLDELENDDVYGKALKSWEG